MTQIYDVMTGQILRRVWCPDPVAQLASGEAVWDGVDIDGAAEYIDGGVVMTRPDLPLSDAYTVVETLSLEIPEGTLIKCEGARVVADEVPTEITFSEPGEYTLLIHPPFPTRSKAISVTVSG